MSAPPTEAEVRDACAGLMHRTTLLLLDVKEALEDGKYSWAAEMTTRIAESLQQQAFAISCLCDAAMMSDER